MVEIYTYFGRTVRRFPVSKDKLYVVAVEEARIWGLTHLDHLNRWIPYE